jgi:7-cyano-7-deazaguanine reductase
VFSDYRGINATTHIENGYQILEDLIAATDPRFMRLKAIFNVRGGVYTTVIAEHQQQGWEPKTVVNL